ncbi:MAG: hypothetical protein PWQ82_934 [Thermosediminibacterales bacterium]|nr:hypothetical protein [Thermosediminibacterales bacterium]MDK2835475.1 hypothetical protein [Thermosediminibacterales bacterium]
MILVSACLTGLCCKYNGGSNYNEKVYKLVEMRKAIPFCPEQLGGLPTPRPPSEIINGDGKDIFLGKAKVINSSGEDVTQKFIKGAEESLKLAKTMRVKKAILKSRSPSCGCGMIYDGTFSGRKKKGNGVTAELFMQNGIEVITEEEYQMKERV